MTTESIVALVVLALSLPVAVDYVRGYLAELAAWLTDTKGGK